MNCIGLMNFRFYDYQSGWRNLVSNVKGGVVSILKFQIIFLCFEMYFLKLYFYNRNEIINCQNIFLVFFCVKQCEFISYLNLV